MIQGGAGKYLFVQLTTGDCYWCQLGDAPGRAVRTSTYEIQLSNCTGSDGRALGLHVFPKTAIARTALTFEASVCPTHSAPMYPEKGTGGER